MYRLLTVVVVALPVMFLLAFAPPTPVVFYGRAMLVLVLAPVDVVAFAFGGRLARV